MLQIIIITSLFCIGFKIATEPEYILKRLGDLFRSIINKSQRGIYPYWIEYIIDPIWNCIYCMSSVYSIIFYSIFAVYEIKTIWELPIIIVCVCGLNGILLNLLNIKFDE